MIFIFKSVNYLRRTIEFPICIEFWYILNKSVLFKSSVENNI